MSQQVFSIPIDKISAVEEYLIRVDKVDEWGINPGYLKDLETSDPSTWPPVTLVNDGNGGYELVDGYHRLVAAQDLGLTDIHAVILPYANREVAFAINLKHGLHLTVKDRKEHARYLHDQHPEWSDREIARRTHLDHTTVSKTLQEMDGENRQADELPVSDTNRRRMSAARTILVGVKKLWATRGVPLEYSEKSVTQELAQSMRALSEKNPEFKHALARLKELVDAALWPA